MVRDGAKVTISHKVANALSIYMKIIELNDRKGQYALLWLNDARKG